MITNSVVLAIAGLLAPFLPVTKALFGFSPLLGSQNPYTTILRGIALSFGALGLSAFAGVVGPWLVIPAVILFIFIGFFNVAIILEGLFYASGGPRLHRTSSGGLRLAGSYWSLDASAAGSTHDARANG